MIEFFADTRAPVVELPITGRITIIDDDLIAGGMLAYTLEAAGHHVVSYESGNEAVTAFEQLPADGSESPEVIFVDIEMPGMNGYETCRTIKASARLKNAVVIFLSGHDALDERLAAYDAGGDDFIAKPYAADEVLRKAEVAVRHVRKSAEETPTENQQEAIQAAMTAMTSLGETGIALRFSQQALGCLTQTSLARQIISTLAAFGLNSHVQLRAPDITLTMTPNGPASPLEESVFEKIRSLERIFSFKNRMVVNYERVSILITDMPVDNPDFCGRIRDHAAVIAEAAMQAIDNIYARSEAVRRSSEQAMLAEITQRAVQDLQTSYRDIQVAARVELESMTHTLESMYYNLGLTENQEALITEIVHKAHANVLNILDRGAALDKDFGGIVARLSLRPAAETSIREHSDSNSIELW